MGIGFIIIGSLLIYGYINSIKKKGFSMRHVFMAIMPLIGLVLVILGISLSITNGQ